MVSAEIDCRGLGCGNGSVSLPRLDPGRFQLRLMHTIAWVPRISLRCQRDGAPMAADCRSRAISGRSRPRPRTRPIVLAAIEVSSQRARRQVRRATFAFGYAIGLGSLMPHHALHHCRHPVPYESAHFLRVLADSTCELWIARRLSNDDALGGKRQVSLVTGRVAEQHWQA